MITISPRVFLPLIGMIAAFCQVEAATIIDPSDDPLVTAQMYRDEAALYPMVGKVTGSVFNGSGVLLSDRWVLTAGHVADFKTGGNYNIGGVNYTIESVISHPNHTLFSTTYDVGLLRLTTAVVGIEAATMFRFDAPDSLLGREATWVGNGVTGTGKDDNRGTNEMRGFTNIIDGFTPRAGLPVPSFFADFDNPAGTGNSLTTDPVPTRLEGNVTAGDSGGGVFVTMGGQRYLVGISSYTSGFAPGLNSKYGSLSGAANLDFFHSWIFDNTGIQAVPEPAVWWTGCLGSLMGFRRRR